ncbi:hypothetical protein [Desulfoluna butyratoxydans]|uniref:Uncharacterized protein n=1 Tax=Desulfoluna butyratoxydans TaxID=231438 RepID=A0A4U8YWC4_9BACT|nr:hypothetical protein [Desulfoluna butyratoxydans]VFQ46312.1 hypothetical protein MSL71_39760 [Desulfoluna butyratoxydans]
MSSVLEALKRMEEEEKHAGNVGFAGVAPRQKTGFARLLPFVAVFVAGVGLAGAGFYLAYGRGPTVVADEAPLGVTSVFRVVAPSSPVTQDSSSAETQSRPISQVASSPGATAPLSEPDSPVGPAVEPEPVSESIQASQGQGQPVAALPDVPELSKDELRRLPAADSGTYRLQGVRWSQTPSRRIAVINSQIIREGASVDGARVLSISKEGVVLDIAGVEMFLAFVGR